MIYALEFYWSHEDGGRDEVGRQQQQAKSLQVIEARARATVKNVVMRGRRANLCIIRDLKGRMLSAVADGPLKALAVSAA